MRNRPLFSTFLLSPAVMPLNFAATGDRAGGKPIDGSFVGFPNAVCDTIQVHQPGNAVPVSKMHTEYKFARSKSTSPWAQAGFTLLELLVVMVIIGLLAGYVAPRYFAQIGKAEVKVARAQMDALEKSLEQYRLDTGHFPTQEQGLAAIVKKPSNEPRWEGPYLKKELPMDPWGRPYIYKIPGSKGDFEITSLGKDGVPGGVGEAADLHSN